MAIDPQTYNSYLTAEATAKVQGRSLVEVLDYRRLLLTQEREHQIRVDVLTAMYKRLEQKSIGDLLRVFAPDAAHDVTPARTFEVFKQWLETFITAVQTKTLE
jgi:hypothetical protein